MADEKWPQHPCTVVKVDHPKGLPIYHTCIHVGAWAYGCKHECVSMCGAVHVGVVVAHSFVTTLSSDATDVSATGIVHSLFASCHVPLSLLATSMDPLPPCPSDAPTAPQLAEVLVDFLEAAFHQVLCVRRVYPVATFRRVRRFGQLCWWSQSAALSAYLRDVCSSVKEALQRQLLHRLLIVLLDEQERECERYIFEFTPLPTPIATVAASTTAARRWPGRAEKEPFPAAGAAQQPPVGSMKSYTVSGRREDSSTCSSSTSLTTRIPDGTCSNIPTVGTSSYRCNSTPRGHGSFEGDGGGSHAWRRLTAVFQDALTRLELVGCWLDADDADDQADEDSEDSCSEEYSEGSTGAAGEIREGTPDQTAKAPHLPSPLPSSASSRSCNITRMGVTVPRNHPVQAAQCCRTVDAGSPSEAAEDIARGGDAGGNSNSVALPIPVAGGARGRFYNKGGRPSFPQTKRSCRSPAKSFRVQLQQDAEVLQSLDTTAAAVSRPLSCFDEDLRAMLLLRSRWLPSATSDSAWGLPSKEWQQSTFGQSLADETFCAPPGDSSTRQRSSTSRLGTDVRTAVGPCFISQNTSNDPPEGADSKNSSSSSRNSVEGTPLFDSFVLASVPRSMIFAWRPQSRFGRAASPVLPCAQQFGRSGAALLRIIVQQSRGGLRSPEGRQQRAKRPLSSPSMYAMQSHAVSTAAAEGSATAVRESQRQKERKASESPLITATKQKPIRKHLQHTTYESQSDRERQLGTKQQKGECLPQKKHLGIEHTQQEEARSQERQQVSRSKCGTAQERAEKLKTLKRYRTSLPEKDGTTSVRSRIHGGSGKMPEKGADDKPPSRLDTPLVVDVMSSSFMDPLLVSESAATAVVDAVKKRSSTGAESVTDETPELRGTTSSEDKFPPECDEESGTALLFDAHLDNLF